MIRRDIGRPARHGFPVTKTTVDINVDVGEGGAADAALLALATSANIACGGHAGGGAVLSDAIAAATAAGVAVGAHPGYPDRANFGRLETGMSAAEIAGETRRQLERFMTAAERHPTHVKPHGALYHRLDVDAEAARVFCDVVSRLAPAARIVGFAGGGLAQSATAGGLLVSHEGFIDRSYGADGRLVARGQPDAVIRSTAAAAAQALELLRRGGIDTLCVHGDGDHAAAILRAAREALIDAGVAIAAPSASHRKL